jgi:hypothetical protein
VYTTIAATIGLIVIRLFAEDLEVQDEEEEEEEEEEDEDEDEDEHEPGHELGHGHEEAIANHD